MPKLKHTKVKRCPLTASETASASKWTEVQNLRKDFNVWRPFHVASGVNTFADRTFLKGKESLSFTIEINAAGGGFTVLHIDIGIDDFPAILELIAKKIPDTASIFSKCASIANNSTDAVQDT